MPRFDLMQTLLRTFLLAMIPSFSVAAGAPDGMDSSLRFERDETQGEFLQVLAKQSVPFHVHEDGVTSYHSRNEIKLRQAAAATLRVESLSEYYLVDEKIERRITAQLKLKGIGYALNVRKSKRWLVWSPSDDKRVNAIIVSTQTAK